MVSATAEKFNPDLWVWGTDDSKPRFLHAMIRVRDLDVALRFYAEGFGMKPMSAPFEFEQNRATAVFVGFDSYAAGGCLELIKLWDDTEPYTHGSGYGHISIGTPDIEGMTAKLEAMGAEITVRPVVLLEGGPAIAFVKDPDGYLIELIQTARR